jgi:sugar/nucleoside kinase (ribokinase family)
MTQQKSCDAVVAGHICLDIIPDLAHMDIDSPDGFFVPGKLIDAGPATLSTGGAVSNTGLALVKLGTATALMGKVGADPFGEVVQSILASRWGVTEGLIVDAAAATSYSIVVEPGSHDRMFLHCPAANDTFCAADIDYDLVATTRLFHFGYPPLMQRMFEDDGQQVAEIMQRVHDLGVTTSLDMALPDPASPAGQVDWDAMLRKTLPHLDIFMPSAEEILFMLNRSRFDECRSRGQIVPQLTGEDLHALGETMLAYGAKVIAIKCGHRGYYLRTAPAERFESFGRARPADLSSWTGRELWRGVYTVEQPTGATGAGDNSIAGFLAALLRGCDLDRAVCCALAAGANNLLAPDALSGLKPWDDMLAQIDAGWPAAELTVTGQGWSRQGETWIGPADTNEKY